MEIDLRDVRPDDLSIFFDHQRDAGAAAMAGVTPRDRAAFDAHWRTILTGPQFVVRTVEADGAVAGYVSAFPREDRQEIAYWIGREHWRKGVGTGAVRRFLESHGIRPLFGTVAATNTGSLAILLRCGFVGVGETVAPDGFREQVLRLD